MRKCIGINNKEKLMKFSSTLSIQDRNNTMGGICMKKTWINLLLVLISLLLVLTCAAADPVELTLSSPATVTIDEAGEVVYFSFVPTETNYYRCYSASLDEADTYGYLYDSDMNLIKANDDDGSGSNFQIAEQLVAGDRYYIGAKYWSSSKTGSFTVQIEEYDGLVSAEAVGDNSVYVDLGASLTLQVSAISGGDDLSYQWYHREFGDGVIYEPAIEGAVTDTIITDPITNYTEYYCRVSDSYGRITDITFYVHVDNHFRASRIGQEERFVLLNDQATLAVEGSCNDGNITYQWYELIMDGETWGHYDPIDKATTDTLVIANVNKPNSYYCRVNDEYGNSEDITFRVRINNHFEASRVGGEWRYIPLNEKATLKVEADCENGDITYQWYELVIDDDNNSHYDPVENANADTFITENIDKPNRYYCRVNDEYGNSKEIQFEIYVDNNLTAVRDSNSDEFVEFGSPATLKVIANCNDGEPIYQWYKYLTDGTKIRIDNATSDVYVTDNISRKSAYCCLVRDIYGNTIDVWFYISINNHLEASSVDSEYKYVDFGKNTTLAINAKCDNNHLFYQWYEENRSGYNYSAIDNATTSTFTTGEIKSYTRYYCRISDSYGNTTDVWFHVYVNNHFNVTRIGEEDVYVDYNGQATLAVNGNSDDNDITYQWYALDSGYYIPIENATTDTCITGRIVKYTQYYCSASDAYGNSSQIYFRLHVNNHLTATRVGNEERYVELNEQATLAVNASCDDNEIYYQWYGPKGNNDYTIIVNATTDTLITAAVARYARYYCRVSDKYGNSIEISFDVYPENHFTVTRVGDHDVYVAVNGKATFEVNASCTNGKIFYQWYKGKFNEGTYSAWENIKVDGATSPTFTTDEITHRTRFDCKIWDEYGNTEWISFEAFINNDFSAWEAGNSYLQIEPDSSATLEVETRCINGPLTYQWYRWIDKQDSDWTIIEGAKSESMATEPIDTYCSYRCNVSDPYGNSRSVTFNVYIDNKLTASPVGDTSKVVDPNGTVDLAVTASRKKGSITYQWFECGYDENQSWRETVIQGANSATYTAGPIAKQYRCTVMDNYGNERSVTFYVTVDNNFKVLTSYSNQIFCDAGEDVPLMVTASCADENLNYRWSLLNKSNYSWNVIEEATTNTCTLNHVDEYQEIRCYVSDQYGNNSTVYYYVNVTRDTQIFNIGETKRIHIGEENKYTLFSLQPENSGTYRLYSQNSGQYWSCTAYLLDANRITIEELNMSSYNPRANIDLAANTQYYLAVVCRSYNIDLDHIGIRLVESNHLVAFCENGRTYDWGDYRVGEPMTLKAYAFCDYGSISYQWYINEEPIPGATSSTYTINNLEDYTYFECLVSDDTGDSIQLGYEVYPIWFEIFRKGNEYIRVAEGETVTLEVESWAAEGIETNYTWYYNDGNEQQIIEGATTNLYSFQATSNNMGTYECRLTKKDDDSDNGSNWCGFTVTLSGTDTPIALTLNAEAIAPIAQAGEYALFSFTPVSEGTYILTWHNYRAIGNLYDESWNEIDSIDFYGDDAVPYVHYLEAGKTYYYAMKHYGDSTDPIIIELTEPSYEEEMGRSVKIHAINTTVEKNEGYALLISSDESDNRPTTVELWATEGNETYIAERWREGGYSVSTVNYVDSRPNATIITYFARAYYWNGNHKDSEPVTITVTDALQEMDPVSFTTETVNGALVVTASCPSYVESGMVSIWNGSTFYNAPYTVQNPVVMMENVLPGQYLISVSASATGYRSVTVPRWVIAHASTKMILPAYTTVIEDEAFFGSAAVEIVLPDQCTTIGDGAFANCAQLRMIYMPDSVVNIAGNAFNGSEKVIFLCESDNAAAAYARNKGIDYIIE